MTGKKLEAGSEAYFALMGAEFGYNFLCDHEYRAMQAYSKKIWDAAQQGAATANPPWLGKLAEAVLVLNASWNNKESEATIAGDLDLCRRLALNIEAEESVEFSMSMFATMADRDAAIAASNSAGNAKSHAIPDISKSSILLSRAVRQIERWSEKYGEHQPEWLPPAGDVRLLEDIDDFLKAGQNTGNSGAVSDFVTLESALKAIDHVDRYRGLNCEDEAKKMLVHVQPNRASGSSSPD